MQTASSLSAGSCDSGVASVGNDTEAMLEDDEIGTLGVLDLGVRGKCLSVCVNTETRYDTHKHTYTGKHVLPHPQFHFSYF